MTVLERREVEGWARSLVIPMVNASLAKRGLIVPILGEITQEHLQYLVQQLRSMGLSTKRLAFQRLT